MLVRNHSLREYLLIYSGGGGIYVCKNNSGCFFLHCKAYKINFQILLKIAHCIHSSGPLFFNNINIFSMCFNGKHILDQKHVNRGKRFHNFISKPVKSMK